MTKTEPCVWALAGFVLALATPVSWADGVDEPIPSYYQEPGLSPNRDYVNQHANEHVDPFSGKLQLHYVDLHIPGNGGLNIDVQRSYTSVADVSDVGAGEPSPVGYGWTMHFGRVLRQSLVPLCSTVDAPVKNPVLELPDGSRQILYVALDSSSFISTARWRAVCTAESGFSVFSPDGTRYDMNTSGPSLGDAVHPIATYYATRITDRNDNTLSIAYEWLGANMGVKTVTSSDGRAVTFNYVAGAIDTIRDGTVDVNTGIISDGARVWTYRLARIPEFLGDHFQLSEVIRPDGASWKYEYNDGVITAGKHALRKLTYPNGGTLNYSYDFVAFANVIGIPRSTVVTRKIQNAVTCPNDPLSLCGDTWTFTYQPATQVIISGQQYEVGQGIDRPELDRTTVVAPDGTRQYLHYGYTSVYPGIVYLMGSRMATVHYGAQVEVSGWNAMTISNQANVRPGNALAFDPSTSAPIMSVKLVNRDGLSASVYFGETQPGGVVNSGIPLPAGFDAYGNPTLITEVGTDTRVTTLTYYNDPTKWIIGKPQDVTVDGKTIRYTYDADNGNVLTESRYGVPTVYTYTTEGDVANKTDARFKTTTLSDYKRGIPRLENHPEGVTIARLVSDTGNIDSETDGEQATTTYEYDGLNRLTKITRPAGNPVMITWARATPATQATRTARRGSHEEVVTYDEFGREIKVVHTDLANATSITRNYKYDPAGRRTFASYPNSARGTGMHYDILGRVWAVGTNSDSDVTAAETWRTYRFAANTVELTNERSLKYVYRHRIFGDHDKAELMGVDTQEPGTNLTLERNLYGNLTRVTQGSLSRTYAYDDHLFLMSKTDPEIGTTVFGRDEVGNVNSHQVGTSPLTRFTYDGLNRVTGITYPAGTPSVSRGYYRDNNPKFIDNGLARTDFVYSPNKNLLSETLSIDGQPYLTQYGYNDNDALTDITYPSGSVVSYQPDSFGRPTKAAPYVTAVTYHPTGQISSMAYANGVNTTIDLNSRLLPYALKIGKTQDLINSTYQYDGVGNVTAIGDSNAAYGRMMRYDNIDRLIGIDGPWGTGSGSYDAVGNLTSLVLGGSNLSYTYSPTTNLLLGVTGAKTYSFQYDVYGNVRNNGSIAFEYDDAATMRCAKCGLPDEIRYGYDGANMRVRGTQNSQATYFVYGRQGQLLYERTPGVTNKEYIYLGGKQVATRQQPEPAQ